jgi:HNH endonuclease
MRLDLNMAFNSDVKRKILRDRRTSEPNPCVMCGVTYPLPEAAHIIDSKEWRGKIGCDRQTNGIPLCPNCHKVFDEVLRPYLYNALTQFGALGLPEGWRKSNKLTEVTDHDLGLDERASDLASHDVSNIK